MINYTLWVSFIVRNSRNTCFESNFMPTLCTLCLKNSIVNIPTRSQEYRVSKVDTKRTSYAATGPAPEGETPTPKSRCVECVPWSPPPCYTLWIQHGVPHRPPTLARKELSPPLLSPLCFCLRSPTVARRYSHMQLASHWFPFQKGQSPTRSDLK